MKKTAGEKKKIFLHVLCLLLPYKLIVLPVGGKIYSVLREILIFLEVS